MQGQEILFLAHRVPWPADRGDKIRSHNMLRHLATLAPVHLACFGETGADMAWDETLAEHTASHCMVKRTKPVPLAAAEALVKGLPVALPAFYHPKIAEYVQKTLASGRIGAVFVFSSQMAQYLPQKGEGQGAANGVRMVMDFVDMDSAKFVSYAEAACGIAALPKAKMFAREARLLGAFERDVARRVDASIFISAAERELFLEKSKAAGEEGSAPVDPKSVYLIGNGINADYFDPAKVKPADIARFGKDAKLVLFSGQMDYPPNIEAAERFSRRVMPMLLTKHPRATFVIAGRNPSSEVRALEGVNRTVVLGEVEDMRCWLQAADLVTAPLTIARGVQNKVLEAMAMARPVLLSEGAATGIEAEDGKHFVIARSDEDFAAKAAEILRDKPRASKIGKAARRQLIAKQSWEAHLAGLGPLLGLKAARAAKVASATKAATTAKTAKAGKSKTKPHIAARNISAAKQAAPKHKSSPSRPAKPASTKAKPIVVRPAKTSKQIGQAAI